MNAIQEPQNYHKTILSNGYKNPTIRPIQNDLQYGLREAKDIADKILKELERERKQFEKERKQMQRELERLERERKRQIQKTQD